MKTKFLSIDWFEKRMEKAIDKAALKHVERMMGGGSDVPRGFVKKVKLVNNTLTVILEDGSFLTKPNATVEDFHAAKEAKTVTDIYFIISDGEVISERAQHEAKVKEVENIRSGFEILKKNADFIVNGASVELAGTGRTLPASLVSKFANILYDCEANETDPNENEEYVGLKRFFMWCCLNPRAEVANDLYDFLDRNSFRITKQGFFVALRNVVTIEQDNELVQFVSNAYNKVKAIWKKSPGEYFVWRDDEDEFVISKEENAGDGDMVGNLLELYLDLPNMKGNRFTDYWTGTFDIKIGEVVSMPMEECNWSTQDCATAGLHFTSDSINYVGCGDTAVLTLINPMKVVGIGTQKGRCYEYLPIMAVDREEATEILHNVNFDTLQLDEEFVINELENLEFIAQNGFVTEAKKHEFNLPQMSSSQLKAIVTSLSDMKAEIEGRVKHVD